MKQGTGNNEELAASSGSTSKLLRRKQQGRRYSVDADLQEFRDLRTALQADQERFRALAGEEHTERTRFLNEEAKLRDSYFAAFVERKRRIRYVEDQNFLAELREQCGHGRMRELIAHSREVQQMQREEAERARKAAQEKEIAQYRRKIQKMREHWQTERQTEFRNRRINIFEEQQNRSERLQQTKMETLRQRAQTSLEMRQEAESHRQRRVVATVTDRIEKRKKATHQRRSTVSASAFLQLPPLKEMLRDDKKVLPESKHRKFSIGVGSDNADSLSASQVEPDANK
jgi:hypothetical protein